jgi:hypothetical protein
MGRSLKGRGTDAMTEASTSSPANIAEFNAIAGLVFAQLYPQFPVVIDLDRQAIANSFGVQGNAWGDHKLPSGKSFADMFAGTLGWLKHENYIASFGPHPAERVMLTEKGLAALNAIPQGLSATVGTSLVQATSGSNRNWSGIGDLVGGVIGGFTKSVSGS